LFWFYHLQDTERYFYFPTFRLFDESRKINTSLELRDNFNQPQTIEEPTHLDSLIRGLATQRSQKSDLFYENDVRTVSYDIMVCSASNKLLHNVNSQISYTVFFQQLTEMLYSSNGQFGMDVMSLDIQQGRDHGLPGYNHYRKFCGLPAVKSFDGFLDVMSKSVSNMFLFLAYTHTRTFYRFIICTSPIESGIHHGKS